MCVGLFGHVCRSLSTCLIWREWKRECERVTSGLIIVCCDVCKYLDIFVKQTCQGQMLFLMGTVALYRVCSTGLR